MPCLTHTNTLLIFCLTFFLSVGVSVFSLQTKKLKKTWYISENSILLIIQHTTPWRGIFVTSLWDTHYSVNLSQVHIVTFVEISYTFSKISQFIKSLSLDLKRLSSYRIIYYTTEYEDSRKTTFNELYISQLWWKHLYT